MRRVLAAAAVLSLVAGGAPALAAGKKPVKPAVFSACKAPAGAFVVKPGKDLTMTVATPPGELLLTKATVGDFYLDLGGKPKTTKGNLAFSLDWDNPLIADYDLIVDGVSSDGTSQPEVYATPATHCTPVHVETTVFLGAPIDTLTLTTTA